MRVESVAADLRPDRLNISRELLTNPSICCMSCTDTVSHHLSVQAVSTLYSRQLTTGDTTGLYLLVNCLTTNCLPPANLTVIKITLQCLWTGWTRESSSVQS